MMLGEHCGLSQLICKLYFVRCFDLFHTESTQESKSEATHAIPTHLTASIALISRILTLALTPILHTVKSAAVLT